MAAVSLLAKSNGHEPLLGFDVGAGIGVYSRSMARVCDHVYALEPQPLQARFIADCGYPGVEVVEAAASRDSEDRVLRDASTGGWRRPLATLERRPDACWSMPCKSIRLDDLARQAETRWPGFAALVKIDIEGHEGAALAGARALVERPNSQFIIEIEARHNPDYSEVFELFAAHGYGAFAWEGGKLRESGPWEVSAMRNRSGGRLAALKGYRSNYIFTRLSGA